MAKPGVGLHRALTVPIVTTRSVVLQTYPYSDTSKILRLMTLEHGPRSAIAKGARRPGSRFGGLIEPFAEGHATLYLKENRDLHTLSDFDLLRDRQGLGTDLMRFAGGSVLCELVMRLAPEHRDDRLFASLVRGLDALLEAETRNVERTALRGVWDVVRTLGFTPELHRCVACRREIGERGAGFDHAEGGLRCPSCRAGGRDLDPTQVAALRALVGDRPVEGEVDPVQRRLVVDFIRYHMAEGLHLKSLAYLERGGR